MKSFKTFLAEDHYEDFYGKAIHKVIEKYSNIPNKELYSVNFTDKLPDSIDKTFNPKPSHTDPTGIYCYPLPYFLEKLNNVPYKAGARYLRVVKNLAPNKTVDLQKVDKKEFEKYVSILDPDWNDRVVDWDDPADKYQIASEGYDEMYSMLYGDDNNGAGHALFRFIQNFGQKEKKVMSVQRPNSEQTKNALAMGILALYDSATFKEEAIINRNEPNQILFLRRDAFEIVDVYEIVPPEKTKTKQQWLPQSYGKLKSFLIQAFKPWSLKKEQTRVKLREDRIEFENGLKLNIEDISNLWYSIEAGFKFYSPSNLDSMWCSIYKQSFDRDISTKQVAQNVKQDLLETLSSDKQYIQYRISYYFLMNLFKVTEGKWLPLGNENSPEGQELIKQLAELSIKHLQPNQGYPKQIEFMKANKNLILNKNSYTEKFYDDFDIETAIKTLKIFYYAQ